MNPKFEIIKKWITEDQIYKPESQAIGFTKPTIQKQEVPDLIEFSAEIEQDLKKKQEQEYKELEKVFQGFEKDQKFNEKVENFYKSLSLEIQKS